MTNVEKLRAILEEMAQTYERKNHDYGNSFDDSLDRHGLVASVVRIGDKMNRFETLSKKKAMVADESLRDTLLDMANYAIMTVMWIDGKATAALPAANAAGTGAEPTATQPEANASGTGAAATATQPAGEAAATAAATATEAEVPPKTFKVMCGNCFFFESKKDFCTRHKQKRVMNMYQYKECKQYKNIHTDGVKVCRCEVCDHRTAKFCMVRQNEKGGWLEMDIYANRCCTLFEEKQTADAE